MNKLRLIFFTIALAAGLQIYFILFNYRALSRPALQYNPEQLAIVYITFSYLVVAILIVLEKHHLKDFHIDEFSIYIFIFSSFLRIRSGVVGENLSLIIMAIAGIFITLLIYLRKINQQKASVQWALSGIGIGLIISVLMILMNLFFPKSQMSILILNDNLAMTAIKSMLYVFPNVVVEEMLFRGFLWGYLEKMRWSENRIAWCQGVLFWVLHSSRILIAPVTFLIGIPLLTFASTKLLIKSRQTYPPILSHALINIMSRLFYLATI